MNKSMGERQRWAWLSAGVSAIAAAQLSGWNWLWVLLASVAVCLYYLYIDKKLGAEGMASLLPEVFGFAGKVLAILLLFWLVLVMGRYACLADTAFPMVDGFPGLGWVLLALAAWGSGKGAAACAGCSGILCLFLLALYGAVVIFAVPNVNWSYLMPSGEYEQAAAAFGMLLVPGVVWCLPVGERKGGFRLPIILLPLGAAALCAVTSGVLSPELAKTRSVPIYDLAQSVSILGVVERIEPLLSAAMTMGLFSLLSALACACRGLADQVGKWKWSGSVCCLGAAVVMYGAKELPEMLYAVGNGVFFLFLPIVALSVQKKLKK